MNILNRIKSFHPGPVCKAVVLFVVLFGLALVFGILPIEYNRKEDVDDWQETVMRPAAIPVRRRMVWSFIGISCC